MHFQEKIGHRSLFIMSALFPNAMETLNPSVWTTNRDRDETKKKKRHGLLYFPNGNF